MIEYIIAPGTFATPHLFNTNNTLPATFTALEDSILLMATKESTFKVISQDPQVLHNFLCIAGNCNICTVSRLKPLSRKTVRERFIVYLYEHKKKRFIGGRYHAYSIPTRRILKCITSRPI